ncbi:MAG: DUF1525 domain-containing protein [Gammaproteobacteria bacterium]|nr:DUF1525 domain-containing protein [Gammaproteobacteria bacterium]
MNILPALLWMAVAPGVLAAEGIRQLDIYTLESIYPARKFDAYRNHPAFPPFRVLDIGQIEWLEAQLSEGLPASEPEAERLARQRLDAHRQSLVSAWKHHMVIRHLGITQLPAIVFNGNEALWYGGRLDRAVQAFTRHQERTGE